MVNDKNIAIIIPVLLWTAQTRIWNIPAAEATFLHQTDAFSNRRWWNDSGTAVALISEKSLFFPSNRGMKNHLQSCVSASKVQVHAGMTPCKTVHLFASWSLGHRIGEVEKFLFWKYACLLPSQDRGGNIDTLVITVCHIKCNTQQLSSLTNIGNTGETSTSSRVTLLSGSP